MDNFIINKEDTLERLLSKKYYFQSLLQLGYSYKLLTRGQLESIQLQLVEVLTETVGYFTKQKSSSVRNDVAEQLMLSICYTIGLYLKSEVSLKNQIDLLKKEKLKSLLEKGEKILEAKVAQCRELLGVAKESRLKTGNYAYVDTLDYGIPLFFQEYDLRFASHEIPGSIDYPLAIDELRLTGIEYIENYLTKLILEDKFSSYFSGKEIEALLRNFFSNSEHMLINVFKLVLTNYLGCTLVGKSGTSLDITKEDRTYLKNILGDLSKKQIYILIHESLKSLCEELLIDDKDLIEYVKETTYHIVQHIKINIETNTLENIFITLNKDGKSVLKYEDGKVLDNNSFRNMAEEIRSCSRVKDKIEIIREEIHSLEDLVDVLGADCIFDDEFFHVFKALDDLEIALLIKRISNDKVWDKDYGTESEKEWHEKLELYLEGLEDSKKEEVINMSQGIDIL